MSDRGNVPQALDIEVCTQSSQGWTVQPQCGTSCINCEGVVDLLRFGGSLAGFVVREAVSEPPVAASMFGIHRKKGVRSAGSTMYQSFLAGSQRAPRALTASFSANGVTRLILIRRIIHDLASGGRPGPPVYCLPCTVSHEQAHAVSHPISPVALTPTGQPLSTLNTGTQQHQTEH